MGVQRNRSGRSMVSPGILTGIPQWSWLMGAALFLFLFKAALPLTDGDSAFYGVIARNMLESGNWQTLHYTEAYGLIDKPPLTIWLIAASYVLFGVNEFAIRGWHALMGVGTVLLVYATARLFYSRTVATLAGWLLLTAALFAYSGFVPQQDIPLTFFSALAFYGLARFLRGDGIGYTYVSWIAVALGLLTRGPQAVVFPALVAIFTLYGTWRQSGSPKATSKLVGTAVRHVLAGAALFLAIAAPWFILEFKQHGWPIIDLLLGTGQSRFFEQLHRGPDVFRFWSYFPLLLVACLPWSGFIGHGLVDAFRRGRQPRTEQSDSHKLGNRLFLAWFLVAFFLPFLTQWRVIRYLLPALPALAVLVAAYVAPLFASTRGDTSSDVTASAQRGVRFAAWLSLLIVVPVLLLVIAVYARAFPEEQRAFGVLLTPFLLTLAAGFGGFFVLTWRRQYRPAIITLLTGNFVAYAVLFAAVGPNAGLVLPSYAAANVVNAHPDEAVVWVSNDHDPFIQFYVQRPLVPHSQLEDTLDEALADEQAVLLLGAAATVEKALDSDTRATEIVWSQDHLAIARVFPTAPQSPDP